MKRWDIATMLSVGRTLFTKVHKQKRFASPNHDVHFMAREGKNLLVEGVQSIKDGSYTPRHLRRYYFKDEMVDELHVSDRILQHVILKQLKPTFPYVMNPNCYHLQGPNGVKIATQRVRQVLRDELPKYIIRADIKSFYKSIPHYQLIQDVKKYYDDPKLQAMLEEIITNPIETPRGYKNPNEGIALRGPLSQFFSGLYLKPLDDAFNTLDVTYIRYQDDILILCKSLRQLNRCKRLLFSVLAERRLSLSGKKTRIGDISEGFHFLGIDYPGTRPLDNTTVTQAKTASNFLIANEHYLLLLGADKQSLPAPDNIVPHARTLRKAREHVKQMVESGVSPPRIKSYLYRWCTWWVRTSGSWEYHELLEAFLKVCWTSAPAVYAAALLSQALRKLNNAKTLVLQPAADSMALATSS